MRRRFLLLLLAASAALATTHATQERPARRVVFVSFDSGADWIVDRLIAAGKAPAFAAMVREGAQADAMISVIPSLTAVAHASLWTGAFPRAHGITDVRIRDHEVSQSIYLSDPDGNNIELYVDADPAIWRARPETVATSRPLTL